MLFRTWQIKNEIQLASSILLKSDVHFRLWNGSVIWSYLLFTALEYYDRSYKSLGHLSLTISITDIYLSTYVLRLVHVHLEHPCHLIIFHNECYLSTSKCFLPSFVFFYCCICNTFANQIFLNVFSLIERLCLASIEFQSKASAVSGSLSLKSERRRCLY